MTQELKRYSGSLRYAKAPIVTATNGEEAELKIIAKMREMFATLTDEQVVERIIVIPRTVGPEKVYPDSIEDVITLLKGNLIISQGITFDFSDFEFIPKNPESIEKFRQFLIDNGADAEELRGSNLEDGYYGFSDDDDDEVILKDNQEIYKLVELLGDECIGFEMDAYVVQMITK